MLMARVPVRILFVTHTPDISGSTYSLLMLVRYLKDRYDMAVLLPEKGALCDLLADEGVRCFVIPGLRRTTIPKIFQLVRQEGIDLVYGNTASRCSRNAMLAAKLARKPFVWHFREVKRHWTWREGFFLRWADEVVAVSQACAEPLKRFYSRKEINVIYNGVELSTFDGDRVDARRFLAQQLGLSPDAKHIISASRLTSGKGHEQAVAIIAQLVREIANVHLVVAGGGDYIDEVRKMIQRQGLGDHIHLVGFRTDIPRLLCGSDVFLFTSERDAHPRAVIEAMAAGLPVAAFGVDGVAETVVDGETGYLLPAGDVTGLAEAVLYLLRHPAQAAEMGQRGRERIEDHFTAARTAAQVSQVIEKLL